MARTGKLRQGVGPGDGHSRGRNARQKARESFGLLVSHASQVGSMYNGIAYALDGGDLRSNSDIILNARASVFGDAAPGPEGNVQFNVDSYVSGSTTPATERDNLPTPAQAWL